MINSNTKYEQHYSPAVLYLMLWAGVLKSMSMSKSNLKDSDFHIFAGGYPSKSTAQSAAEKIRKRDGVYARVRKLKSGWWVYITKFKRK